ncbi:hypothetical protein HMN09_00992200 [Mycena chlorophos]|uniref:DUF6533 domain-containing protein n=1 Tax=Mycena chlorophos TaxID=658473 RepID=A0A8H6VZV6_MYCCL|nr:hypothetical protein HMN09_00992200 [Mycena chlorophos]
MTQAFTVSEEGLRLQLWVLDILNAISFTLLFYDYFITLEAEVTRFWQRGRKTTLASTLFFTNRYIALLGNFPVIVMYFCCHQLETFHEFYLCFTQFLTAAILCLRTWAIYGRTRKMGIFLLALVFTTLALALFGTLHSLHAPDKVGSQSIYIGCVSPKGQIQSIGFLIAWGALAMFDCIIFALTMYWTWGHFKGMMGAKISRQHRGLSAVRILLRDGTVYFVVIILFNIANILTFAVGNMYTRGIASVFGNMYATIPPEGFS